MPSAAALRLEIEHTLAARIPSALTLRPPVERPVLPTGIAELDSLLQGGLPVGAMTELVGPQCSGRTTLTLSFLSQLTQAGQVCAWIDVADSLDPPSAAAAGVDLARLLWVRCGHPLATRTQVAPPHTIAVSEPANASSAPPRPLHCGGSPHPRNEANGLDAAVEDLMRRKDSFVRDKSIGTPAAANRTLQHPALFELTDRKIERVEQIPYDRMPARRGDHILKHGERYAAACAEPMRRARPAREQVPRALPASESKPVRPTTPRVWERLDQGLRAADLLLQGGGFGALVLDMGSLRAEEVSRVPLATWFRYRAAAERSRTSVVLITQHACAKSSAELVLRLEPAGNPPTTTLFGGLGSTVEVMRQRFTKEREHVVGLRKPPGSVRQATWQSTAAWVGSDTDSPGDRRRG